ncbi:MAG: sigma-54 dependent transcriptional regulator, partial [Desulfovibrionaceae bacterium]|nr:sigma-54 dependent transcriptional regulator [Desulfovibrionaceae bacterium]
RGLVARPENGVWIASAAEGGPAGEVSAGSFAEGGHAARAFEKNTVEFAFRDVPPEHGGPGLLEVGIYFSVHFEDIGCFVYLEGLVPESHRSMFDTAFFNILRSFIISQAVSARYEERLAGRAERADQTGHAGRAAPACAAKGAPERDDGGFACASAVMCRLMDQADRIAPRDTTVLLLGESGVGKEVMARRIHEKSGRTGPFVGVSLAGTPQELFESEFCGHEKGSFTGAASRKKGLLELADGGTLFIDEAGDIPMALQVKLLRLLQEKTFMRVGGTRLISSDFRLVAATNRNLREMVRDGSFREDLYYRLNVVPLNIPPLRERPEDILFLAGRFLERFSARHELPLRPFPAALTARMLKAPWPGNVRQLRNFVERWCLYADSSQVLDADMEETGAARRESAAGAPAAVKAGPGAPPADPQAPVPAAVSPADGADSVFAACPSLRELTDRYFEYVYTRKNGVLSGRDSVAATLGISKPTAHSWASRLKLREKYRLTVAAGRKEEDGGS